MIEPKIGNHYVIHHSSGDIVARFITISHHSGYKLGKARTQYHFTNLRTGREIIIKSRAKIRKEIGPGDAEHLAENQVIVLRSKW